MALRGGVLCGILWFKLAGCTETAQSHTLRNQFSLILQNLLSKTGKGSNKIVCSSIYLARTPTTAPGWFWN